MIEHLSFLGLAIAVLAGTVTVLLPCTYPMLLGYLALIIGDEDSNNIPYAFTTTKWFFIGFSVTYAILGGIAGLFGQFSKTTLLFNDIRPIAIIIGAVFFIVVGLVLLRAIPLPEKLLKNKSFPIPKLLPVHSWWGITLIGVIFATGWSPCIGPVLGSILTLAASSGSAVSGMIFLLVFALGMMIPLAVITFFYAKAADRLKKINAFLPVMRGIGGTLFILLGIFFLVGDPSVLGGIKPPEFLQNFL